MSEDRDTRRTPAEWVSLVAALAVLAAVVVGLLIQVGHGTDPADPVVSIGEVRAVASGTFQVPVDVHNAGDRAAVGVVVTATLVVADDGEVSADQTIDFLGADETATLVFTFEEDPAAGELTVAVGGFGEP